jgi:hypothetical protein
MNILIVDDPAGDKVHSAVGESAYRNAKWHAISRLGRHVVREQF